MTLHDILAARSPEVLDLLTRIDAATPEPAAPTAVDAHAPAARPLPRTREAIRDAARARRAQSAASRRPAARDEADAPADIVVRARAVLRELGIDRAVIVGGQRGERPLRALSLSFGIEFDWRTTVPSSTCRAFAAAVRGADLIIAATRWSRHTHGDYINRLHRRDGVPLVRLTGGYNPNAVAHAVLTQLAPAARPTKV